MYTVKIVNEYYEAPGAYSRLGKYIINADKTGGDYTAYGVLTGQEYSMEKSMNAVYRRRTTFDDISCQFHVVISFNIPNTEEVIFELYQLSTGIVDYIGENYQVVAGVHHMDMYNANENPYPHIHLQINAVSWRTGKHIENNEDGRRIVRAMVKNSLTFAQSYINGESLLK